MEEESTYLNKLDTLKHTGLSESWLYEWHRKVLLKYSLVWGSTPEQIKEVCTEIKKVLGTKGADSRDFEWFNNIKYLPKKKSTLKSTLPKKEPTLEGTQESTSEVPFKKEHTQSQKESTFESTQSQKESTFESTQIVDIKYLKMLEGEYETKKELEKDYRNKDNQINLIVQNLTNAMKILQDEMRMLRAPKEPEEKKEGGVEN